MATIRERAPGVWEIRVFTGRNAGGKPTQVSRTVRGTKRDAKRVAAALEARPAPNAAGRAVRDVIEGWRETNSHAWSEMSKRDYAGRAAKILEDPIADVAIARLGVADVERWHARMRNSGVGDWAIRGRHAVLRAALAQAVRWEWVPQNVAASARLRQAKSAPRQAMSVDEVQAVLEAAATIDPAAVVALRLAAVAGARRAELAALRWTDFDGDVLTIDSSALQMRDDDGVLEVMDAPTKTANRRAVRLDPDTVDAVSALRAERAKVSPYLFSLDDQPAPPARIGWWWTRARERSGIDKKWRLHDLRHWSATTAISRGHDVRTVAGRLGHASAAMTLRVYAHAVESADQDVAATLGSVLSAPAERPGNEG